MKQSTFPATVHQLTYWNIQINVRGYFENTE